MGPVFSEGVHVGQREARARREDPAEARRCNSIHTLSPPPSGPLNDTDQPSPCIFTCVDDCEWEKKDCDAQCRKIPVDKKKEREACWSKCENEYADCLKKCKD
ncbi:MAG: hypothetical protein QM820_35050 [Minicystis sp.]